MKLSAEEQSMLAGMHGKAAQKAMQILVALGTIYDAEHMLPVTSVQIAGVSYDNLGEAGLEFLSEMAEDGHIRTRTTLNPAGMDLENWQALGIPVDFAEKQNQVIQVFAQMGVDTTCTCTPYLAGNTPQRGEHIAWAESSAVCYANSVLGARTNREGGPSALAAAITGRTPAYGMHLEEMRRPGISVIIKAQLVGTQVFGASGRAIGRKMEALGLKPVPFIRGIENASQEELKSFCASLATYAGAALFHMEGITPESASYSPPVETLVITEDDLLEAIHELNTMDAAPVDFVSLGCPHLSIQEIARIAGLLEGRQVKKTFWITTARPTKHLADLLGYTAIIEASGAQFASDTCCVVAPIRGRFHTIATDSAKACYYATGKNQLNTVFMPFDEVVLEALEV